MEEKVMKDCKVLALCSQKGGVGKTTSCVNLAVGLAKAQEARAKVIEAEAEVPKAMAEAFRSGNLGIMDYYRMKNIEADTSMRENIAKPTTGNAGNQPLSK